MKSNNQLLSYIKNELHAYDGDALFLVGPSEKTKKLWDKCKVLLKEENDKGGVLGVDAKTISSITSHKPGYIEKDLEVVVGLQTDKPLIRAIKPAGGIEVVKKACLENGIELDSNVYEIFTKYRKTHNNAVYDVYSDDMRSLRRLGILTGLPDSYARGRIIGDYRRLAFYGADELIAQKQDDKKKIDGDSGEEGLKLKEEIADQIEALGLIKEMAQSYGFDISKPAQNAKEAFQWVYFAYLAVAKEQDGAAISLGSVSGFLDIYLEKDLESGLINEEKAQELVDQFIIKLRFIRHLRPKDYMEIFAGDPTWVTESLGGSWSNGKHKVTKTAYRFLQSLYNLGESPEPNLTVLWSKNLPQNFKDFCAKVSIETSSIQYENDDLMRCTGGSDDYGISCCVSRLTLGSQMQYFGARCNLPKVLLLALNEGKDELTGTLVVKDIERMDSEYLDYQKVEVEFKKALSYVAKQYVWTLNLIHYMHDKYYYERAQMAFLDSEVERLMAFGVAGLSVLVDSLSAIKYAKVKAIRNEDGLTTDFEIEGEYPKYGNDDDHVDNIAVEILQDFYKKLSSEKIYREAKATLSVLTITSNIMYGKKTGATPDGRKKGAYFAPGANPMHGRDTKGIIASLNTVAKLPYECLQDGISNTITFTPDSLGKTAEKRIETLTALIDGYFEKKGHHLNINVFNRSLLQDAMDHPENYPQLTIRVSGYAVIFTKLSREQQDEVLERTFFEKV